MLVPVGGYGVFRWIGWEDRTIAVRLEEGYTVSVKTRPIFFLALALGFLRSACADEADSQTEFAMDRPIPKLEALPMPAQLAIKKKAGRRHVARIVREMCGDVPVFRVTFREKGRNPEISVSDDGTVLTPEEVPPSLARALFRTRFEDTPREVQNAVRGEIGDGRILKIEKERREGAACYRIEFSTAARRTAALVVADSGKVLEGGGGAIPANRSTASTN
jgi:hypothetical protein